MKKISLFLVCTLIMFVLFINSTDCFAIPAFARKYQISCQVCHSPAMPRLKPFGDEFAGNGFRMTEYEAPRYLIPSGDEKLSLFRELPLALRVDGFVTYNFDDQGRADFGAPFVLKILSGGELSNKLSYYFYFLFNEKGSIAGAEDVFLVYNDLLNTGINITLGQFQVSDPLYKGELRLTLEPYRIYGVNPGNSGADLKYDRGIVFDKDFKTGTTIVGEIINGCGIGEAGEELLFDNDKYKNFMGRINQAIGKNLSVGFFGYTGKEALDDPGMIYASVVNEIRMFGPDASVNFGDKFGLNVQYLRRTDSEVFVGEGNLRQDVITDGGFAELVYSPKGDNSKWYFAGLGNFIESNIEELDYMSATLHTGYMMRRNVRLVAEFTQVINPASYGKINVGFVAAF